MVLSFVKEARAKGLKAPVLLMGGSMHNSSSRRTIRMWEAEPLPRAPIPSARPSPGYYNPMRAYGEREAVRDAREYGANGFIMVDLPPEEAIKFREICTEEG